MKKAEVTLGGRRDQKKKKNFMLHYSCLIQKINNTRKVCTNRTLKYVHETTVAVEKQYKYYVS